MRHVSSRHVPGAGVVLVMVLFAVSSPLARQKGAEPYVPKGFLASELASLSPMVDGLTQFNQRADALDNKKPAKTDLDALEGGAERVRSAIPEYARAVSATISKLQGAGKWTAELDAFAEAQMKGPGGSPDLAKFVHAQGGSRALLQKAVSRVSALPQDLDTEVREQRKRGEPVALVDWFIAPVHAAPSISFGGSGSLCIHVVVKEDVCFLGGRICVTNTTLGGCLTAVIK
jgi:hypothetical protein